MHLHRALSKLGWGSRTQAWDWIRAGERLDLKTATFQDPDGHAIALIERRERPGR